MTHPVTIRAARPADAEPIQRLIARTLKESNARDYPPDQIERRAQAFSVEAVTRHMEHEAVLIAEADGELLGTATLAGSRVRMFFVRPDQQRSGVGSLLIRRIEELAFEHGLPDLQVYSSITARAFYERHGFTFVRENHMEGELTFVMEKPLGRRAAES